MSTKATWWYLPTPPVPSSVACVLTAPITWRYRPLMGEAWDRQVNGPSAPQREVSLTPHPVPTSPAPSPWTQVRTCYPSVLPQCLVTLRLYTWSASRTQACYCTGSHHSATTECSPATFSLITPVRALYLLWRLRDAERPLKH